LVSSKAKPARKQEICVLWDPHREALAGGGKEGRRTNVRKKKSKKEKKLILEIATQQRKNATTQRIKSLQIHGRSLEMTRAGWSLDKRWKEQAASGAVSGRTRQRLLWHC
jgi:hypothetical protein